MKNIKSNPIQIFFRIFLPAYDFTWHVIRDPDLIHNRRFIAEIFYRYIPTTFLLVWLFSLIPYIGSFIYILIMFLGLFSIYKIPGQKDKVTRLNNSLFYFVIMNWAFLGIRSFIGHTFLANSVADSIGWESGSMFQIELAFYHLGLAIATLTYIWNRSRELLLGLIIAKSIFLFGAMGVHIYERVVNGNINSGNIGVAIIYGDLIVPIIIIWLYWKTRKINNLPKST